MPVEFAVEAIADVAFVTADAVVLLPCPKKFKALPEYPVIAPKIPPPIF